MEPDQGHWVVADLAPCEVDLRACCWELELRPFTMDAFLGSVSGALLAEYLSIRGVAADSAVPSDAVHDAGALMRLLGSVPDAQRRRIECDFGEVFHLGSKPGFEVLALVAASGIASQPEDLATSAKPWATTQDLALWTLLHRPAIFTAAIERYRVVARHSGWCHRDLQPGLTPPPVCAEVCQALAARVQDFYRQQMRAVPCLVRCYPHGEDTYYSAYPDDYAVRVPQYGDDGQLTFAVCRTTFDIVWRYRHTTGRLSIHAQDRQRRATDALAAMFAEEVLGQPLALAPPREFDLTLLREVDDASLLRSAQELYPETEAVHVRTLTLAVGERSGRGITLRSGNPADPDWQPMPTLIRDMLRLDVRAHVAVRVTAADIHVRFGGPTPDSTTVCLRTPDTCAQQDRPCDQKVRRLLCHWGIERG